jgi:predicted aminopeptidase
LNQPLRHRRWLAAGLIAAIAGLAGCDTLGYYGQAVAGHWRLMRQARPVPDWLADPATPEPLRERLRTSLLIREFAVRELKLPDNRSYRSYADLGRPYVVWNVVAAPELSLTLKTWCFTVMGCVGYRGYFDQATAEKLAASLREQHFEVGVYGVPAYSTLGWLDLVGGDPMLNTFVSGPESELARLIFHELAHQVVYAAGDTAFNESFATAVEQIGVRRWLDHRGDAKLIKAHLQHQSRVDDFHQIIAVSRAELAALFKGDGSDADKRERKSEIYAAMRAKAAQAPWATDPRWLAWFEKANNASLGIQAAYTAQAPEFERLLERCNGDFDRFYAEVRRLAALPFGLRAQALRGF